MILKTIIFYFFTILFVVVSGNTSGAAVKYFQQSFSMPALNTQISETLASKVQAIEKKQFTEEKKTRSDGYGQAERNTNEDRDDIEEEYREFVEDWHRNRVERLKDEQGWLRLTGLYWLSEGEQAFGSGERARIRFPEGSIPGFAGTFKLEADTVIMRVPGNVDIRDERGRRVTEDTIYTPDLTREMHYRDLTWFVMRRDDKLGIRLYDDDSPHMQHFDGIERYDIDPDWRVEALFEPREEGTTMMIENVIGQMVEYEVAGELHFTVDGEETSMIALGTGDRLFIPFSDATAGEETYEAGRYVYIDRPEPGEKAIIDFNVSYNPPCAINPYTTCPLPPSENRKDFPIRAGEKRYDMYEPES